MSLRVVRDHEPDEDLAGEARAHPRVLTFIYRVGVLVTTAAIFGGFVFFAWAVGKVIRR